MTGWKQKATNSSMQFADVSMLKLSYTSSSEALHSKETFDILIEHLDAVSDEHLMSSNL